MSGPRRPHTQGLSCAGEPVWLVSLRTDPNGCGRWTPSDLHSDRLARTPTDAPECSAPRGSWVRAPSSRTAGCSHVDRSGLHDAQAVAVVPYRQERHEHSRSLLRPWPRDALVTVDAAHPADAATPLTRQMSPSDAGARGSADLDGCAGLEGRPLRRGSADSDRLANRGPAAPQL